MSEAVLPHRSDGCEHSLIVNDDHGDNHEQSHGEDDNGAPPQSPHQPIACYLQSFISDHSQGHTIGIFA